MGMIHPTHGRLSVETRRDYGFIIHASYGLRTGRSAVGDLKPGAIFLAERPGSNDGRQEWKLKGVFESHVEAVSVQDEVPISFKLNDHVEVPDTEEEDPDDPLGKYWNGPEAGGHPEFKREDLDDLIDALVEVRDA